MTGRPWSNQQIRQLGVSLRDGTPAPPNTPTYDEVALWYLEQTVAIQDRIEAVDWEPLLGTESANLTSRVKTIGTLVEKLRRHRPMPLQQIRDIAGVRFEARMSLSIQSAVCATLHDMFATDCVVQTTDMRDKDHFGYRAMHLELRHPGQGWRAEIQVRTDLQGKWANLYEVAGDILGRDIRYANTSPEQPEHEIVRQLQKLSTVSIAAVEHEFDRETDQEVRVDNVRRGLVPGDLAAEVRKLQALTAAARPRRIELSEQLARLTAELQRTRIAEG